VARDVVKGRLDLGPAAPLYDAACVSTVLVPAIATTARAQVKEIPGEKVNASGAAEAIDHSSRLLTLEGEDGAVVAGAAAPLAEVGVESPEAHPARWLSDRAGLERFAGDAVRETDDRPVLEHAAWMRRGEFQRVVPRLLSVATDVPCAPATRCARRSRRSAASRSPSAGTPSAP